MSYCARQFVAEMRGVKEIKITEEEIKVAVEATVNSKNFELVTFHVRPASETSLGFLGDHERIRVEVKIDGKLEIINYFTKKIPTKIPSHREYAEKTRAFYKEIELFKTLFRDFNNSLSPTTKPLKWHPACYFTRDWDFVLVEDLSFQDYYMLPEGTLMPLDCVKAALQALARMHANSFIFEEKVNAGKTKTMSTHYNPDGGRILIKDLYPNLIFESECTDEPNHPGFKFWEAGIIGQKAIVEALPGYSSAQKEKIIKRYPEVMRMAYKIVKPSTTYKNVMLHADLWNNNVLFRNNPDGTVSDAILVDFQMTRYGPPGQDVISFLYIVQEKSFRLKYEKELLNFYYDSLKSELAVENLNIEGLLPRNEFDDSCAYFQQWGTISLIIANQLGTTPPHIRDKYFSDPDIYKRIMLVDRSDLMIECFETDESYRSIMIDAMENLITLFKLDQ